MTFAYQIDADTILAERPIDAQHTLRLRAGDVRQERAGVHARLSILLNGVSLAWGTINVDKDEDRVRLTNSAYQPIQRNGLKDDYPKEFLKKDIDLFCRGLWDASLSATMPERLPGLDAPQVPTFVVEPYIVEGGGTILFAPPGRGKSYLLMLMAVSIDAGISTLWPVTQTPVIFINLERSRKSLMNRLGNVNAALGLPRNRPLLTLNARGRSLMDVAASARKAIKQDGVGCVFLDSISRAGFGDLTENRPVNAIVDTMNGLAESWLGIAHTPRGDESHVYGSIHFEAGADIMLQILSEQKDGGPLGVGLHITKENDIGKWPMKVVALEFEKWGLSAVRPAIRGEFPDVERGKKPTMREDVIDYVQDTGKASATQTAKATGYNRSKISELFANDAAFVKVGKEGREVLYGLLHRQ